MFTLTRPDSRWTVVLVDGVPTGRYTPLPTGDTLAQKLDGSTRVFDGPASTQAQLFLS